METIEKSTGAEKMLTAAAALLLGAGTLAAFFYAPTEATMGNVQRIFYVHVASAWTAFLGFAVVFVAGIGYLRTGREKWDQLAHAAAEIGTLFCTLVLITGPLWGKRAWGVWWVWDARLTTSLILWLAYLAYNLLRASMSGPRAARVTAVYGILAFLNVPVVYLSARLWATNHPGPVIGGGTGTGLETAMLHTLILCVIAFSAAFFALLLRRTRIERLKARATAEGGGTQ